MVWLSFPLFALFCLFVCFTGNKHATIDMTTTSGNRVAYFSHVTVGHIEQRHRDSLLFKSTMHNETFFVNDIWNKSYMNCGNEMRMKRWSSQWTQFMQSRKEAWKNFRTWPAPNVSGFIAQLVEHRTGNREVTGSNPVEVLNFFQASLRNCINCDHLISSRDSK